MSSVGIEEEGNQPNSFTPKTQVKNIIQELARTENSRRWDSWMVGDLRIVDRRQQCWL